MLKTELFLIFLRPLNRLGIPYMVTGSVAAMAYGEPRLTHDIDLVLELTPAQIGSLFEAFPSDEFYCPPEEVITVELARSFRGRFNLIHPSSGFKADCYLVGQDPLQVWGMENRKKIDIQGEPVFLAPPEYVIVRKLEYFREGRSEKHIRDIQNMLKISKPLINLGELEKHIDQAGLKSLWIQIRPDRFPG